jgi:hypothetical protein
MVLALEREAVVKNRQEKGGFQMEFTDKLNEGVATLTNTVKSGVDTCLLEGKILDRKKKIRQLTKEIGNLAIVKLDEGEEMSPEIMERYSAIVEMRKEIADLEKGKDSANPICPKCGAKILEGMKYCGNCGASLEAVVEEEDDDEDEEED